MVDETKMYLMKRDNDEIVGDLVIVGFVFGLKRILHQYHA
jgi:hypothetical protein